MEVVLLSLVGEPSVLVLQSHVSPNRHLGLVVRVNVPLATSLILDVAAGTGISIQLPGRQI